ncbi:hypothetical protein [Nafulsella turpanensis]|uniref:hypothetical protein n=1 Tax=Nafulsella turpanensis TaxID=1265690 RepID=UPI0003473528|nr:hypothetical protein [Nafulsella turpanensis]
MKKVFASILALALLYLMPAAAGAIQLPPAPADTITIQIGKTKKIIIWVDSKEDLESLQNYDFNQMIRDLNKTVDSLGQLEQLIIITDESGKEYQIEVAGQEEDDEWYAHEADSTEEKKRYHFEFSFGDEDDDDEKDEEEEKQESRNDERYFGTRHFINFDLGMNNYLSPEGDFPAADNAIYAVRPWGSWFVGINSNFRTHIAGPLALQWGAGVDWYNFKFADDRTRLEETEEGVNFYIDPEPEIDAQKSKLTAAYLNVNAVPMLHFGYKTKMVRDSDGGMLRVRDYDDDSFRIGLGGYAGYRIASHTKYKFEVGDDTEKDKDRDDFYLNNWRYGVRLQLGVKGVDLFANYDLNELFYTGKGPELHAFSFGIIL